MPISKLIKWAELNTGLKDKWTEAEEFGSVPHIHSSGE